MNRKFAWIMVLVLAAFMAYTARPVSNSGGAQFSLTDRDGNTVSEYISVAEQRKLIDKGEQRINGQVMDEQFFQDVREASTGNGQYIIQENLDLDSYFYLVDSSYHELILSILVDTFYARILGPKQQPQLGTNRSALS